METNPSGEPKTATDAPGAWLRLYDAWMAGVGVSSMAGLAMASVGVFHGWVMAVILIAIPLAAAWRMRRRLIYSNVPAGKTILLVITLALAWWLRTPPYANVSGGYDPGLYVNMASMIRHDGGLTGFDAFRASLDPEQRALYDARGGALYAGVEMTDAAQSRIQMPFYPLHPIWMAAVGSVFPGHGSGSLVLFGMMAVIGLFLLCGEIAGGRSPAAAYVAMLAVAVHPGLVFLSKYPVGEMLALAFTANGFYYLARAYRAWSEHRRGWDAWVLAALCFNAFYYVRMTGFVYMPVFLGLGLGGLVSLPRRRLRVGWLAGVAVLVLLWLVSYGWYSQYMPRLFTMIYDFIQRCSGRSGALALAGLVALVPAVVIMYARRAQVSAWADRLAPWIPAAVSVLLLVALTMQMRIMHTTEIPGYPDYPSVHIESDTAFTRGFLYRYAVYLFPPVVLVLLLLPWFMRSRGWSMRTCLALFVAWMMAMILLSPYAYSRFYQFYYDRYYLSEVVPYGLLLIIVVLSGPARNGMARSLQAGLLAMMIAYFGWFSILARGKTFSEPPGQRALLEHNIGRDSLVLLLMPTDDPARNLVATPLVYSSRMAVFPLGSMDEAWRPEIMALSERFPRTILLTSVPLQRVDLPPGLPELTLEHRMTYTYQMFTPLAVPEALARQPVRGVYRWIDLPWRVYPHTARLFVYELK